MLRTRIRREAAETARVAERLAAIEASVVALDDEDLLDLADIFLRQPATPLQELAAAEMAKRKIAL
jgi:hypothetical protein